MNITQNDLRYAPYVFFKPKLDNNTYVHIMITEFNTEEATDKDYLEAQKICIKIQDALLTINICSHITNIEYYDDGMNLRSYEIDIVDIKSAKIFTAQALGSNAYENVANEYITKLKGKLAAFENFDKLFEEVWY